GTPCADVPREPIVDSLELSRRLVLRQPAMKFLAVGSLLFLVLAASAPACELGAIYSADSARSESSSGLLFTVAEQFVSSHTILAEGKSFSTAAFLQAAYLDSSITHLVPGYNFSRRFGVSLNVPLEYLRFHCVDL